MWSRPSVSADELEAELPVVIGTRAHRIEDTEALDHVFGYTVANDVTARDHMADGHWTRPDSNGAGLRSSHI